MYIIIYYTKSKIIVNSILNIHVTESSRNEFGLIDVDEARDNVEWYNTLF